MKKTFDSIGPWHIYGKLALLTYYRPDYWRKIARMLSHIRRMDHCDFKGDSYERMVKYARDAYKDTKLPELAKWTLRECIREEFGFDVIV